MLFQLIPTKVHGYIDYLTAALLPVLPRVLDYDHTVTHLHDAVAGTTLASSLLTDYELGAIKLIPMQGHLALDAMTGAGLIVTAAAMDEEDAAPRSCLAGLGLVFLAAALCTKTQPSGQKKFPRYSSRRRGVAIQRYARQTRPDIARPAAERPPVSQP